MGGWTLVQLRGFPAETRMSSAAKISVLALAYCLVVQNYASHLVVGVAGASFILGGIAAHYLVTKPLTTFGASLISSGWFISFYLLGECFDSYGSLGNLWGAKILIQIVDTLRFVGVEAQLHSRFDSSLNVFATEALAKSSFR